MKTIENRRDMIELKSALGVRPDWHEPDEREVSARTIGTHLDNAFGSNAEERTHALDGETSYGEFNVILTKDGEDVAVVNLATLLAIASEPQPTPRKLRDDAEAIIAEALNDQTQSFGGNEVTVKLGGGIRGRARTSEIVGPLDQKNNAWTLATQRAAHALLDRIMK